MPVPPLDPRPGEKIRRVGIVALGAIWLVIGVAFVGYGRNPQVWQPFLVAGLFLAAGATTIGFAARPSSTFLYTWAGTLTTVALVARLASIVAGAILFHNPTTLAVAASGTGITTVVLGLFWWWWRWEVQAWRKHHDTIRRLRRPA